MTGLLDIRDRIKELYSRFEIYISPVIKFLLMFITLSLINGELGYMARLCSSTLVLLVSLIAAILPYNFMLLASAAFIVIHLYKFSPESAVVVLALFVIIFLLYFRFAAADGLLVMLTPVFCMLRIPLVIPVSAGLVCTPASAVSVGCGYIIYSIIGHIKDNETAIESLEADNAIQKFRTIVDGLVDNKALIVTVLVLAVTVIAVYMIRRLSIPYNWIIAIATGLVFPVIGMSVGGAVTGADIELVPWLVGALLSLPILLIVHFFAFTVDYRHTQRVQFEDDEYYYYVKAVPKLSKGRVRRGSKSGEPEVGFGYNRRTGSLGLDVEEAHKKKRPRKGE